MLNSHQLRLIPAGLLSLSLLGLGSRSAKAQQLGGQINIQTPPGRISTSGPLAPSINDVNSSPTNTQLGGRISIEAPLLQLLTPLPRDPGISNVGSSPVSAQSGGNIVLESSGPLQISTPLFSSSNIGEILRPREDEPLVEEPFFRGLGVDVELMLQETATLENVWFASDANPSEAEPALAIQDLSLSFIGTTGKTEQRFVVNAVIQNLSYEPSLNSDASSTAQVLLMEGDRVVAEQTLASPLQPGQAIPVQYELGDAQSPSQPWSLIYRNGNERVALYSQEQLETQRPAIPELQEQDLFK